MTAKTATSPHSGDLAVPLVPLKTSPGARVHRVPCAALWRWEFRLFRSFALNAATAVATTALTHSLTH